MSIPSKLMGYSGIFRHVSRYHFETNALLGNYSGMYSGTNLRPCRLLGTYSLKFYLFLKDISVGEFVILTFVSLIRAGHILCFLPRVNSILLNLSYANSLKVKKLMFMK